MRARTVTVRDLAAHEVVTVIPSATLAECAQIMRNQHVGSVIVIDDQAKRDDPRGIVTDRDIVIEAVALGLDPATLTAGDVMTTPLATVNDRDDILDALARMREHGVRRLPVLDDAGHLSGIVTVDNLLEALAEQLDAVVRVIKTEQSRESVTRK
jgi:signal-transduction protein with cAMP-binding, CBS, and nucleotidyltransferase domain